MASNTYTCLAEVALCCIPLHYPACQRKTIPGVRGKPHTASTVCFCWHPELAGLLQLNSSSKIFPAQCSLSRLWHWEGEGTHTRHRETIMLWVLQGCIDRGENIPQGKENFRQKKNYSRVGFAVSEVWGESGREVEFEMAVEWSCRCHHFPNSLFRSQCHGIFIDVRKVFFTPRKKIFMNKFTF